MKKKLIIIVSLLLIAFQFNNVSACENQLDDYNTIINEINETYNTSFQIITEKEFYNYDYDQLMNKNYNEYLDEITKTDLQTFKNGLLKTITESKENVIEVQINSNARSSFGTKTVNFYAGNNSMTLRYKYSGSKFDTSYKPGVTVKRISINNYFVMNSYTGKFTNSNKTYSVTAQGKIISNSVLLNNKSFTVNFNL